MSFIDTLRRARGLLRGERRLSLHALRRELGLDDDEIGELTDERLIAVTPRIGRCQEFRPHSS